MRLCVRFHTWCAGHQPPPFLSFYFVILSEVAVATEPKDLLLPAVMRKRLIGFRHAVHIFFLLDRRSTAIGRVE
jgi:hypothetical protein